jgi:DNA-binding ferritin-like protein
MKNKRVRIVNEISVAGIAPVINRNSPGPMLKPAFPNQKKKRKVDIVVNEQDEAMKQRMENIQKSRDIKAEARQEMTNNKRELDAEKQQVAIELNQKKQQMDAEYRDKMEKANDVAYGINEVLVLPKKGEDKDDFISRFMSDKQSKIDFPEHKQRVAVAFSQWDRKHNIKEEVEVMEENNQLIKLISLLKVVYGNLHVIHRNLKGEDWFPVHELFGEYYEKIEDFKDDTIEISISMGVKEPSEAEAVQHYESIAGGEGFSPDQAFALAKKYFNDIHAQFELINPSMPNDVKAKFEEYQYWLRKEANYKIAQRLSTEVAPVSEDVDQETADKDYKEAEEESMGTDLVNEAKSGLYDNIHKKRMRIKMGSGEKMRKPNSKGAPTDKSFKAAAKTIKENSNEYEHESGEYDQEGSMAKSQLKNIINHTQELHDMLKDESNLPEWVQSKLAVADDHLTTISDYMKTEVQRKQEESKAPLKEEDKYKGSGVPRNTGHDLSYDQAVKNVNDALTMKKEPPLDKEKAIEAYKKQFTIKKSTNESLTEQQAFLSYLRILREAKDVPSNPEYGVPKLNKFPLYDEARVKSAIRFFNYVEPVYEEKLAAEIIKRMKKYGLNKRHVGNNNRLKKYVDQSRLPEGTAKETPIKH